MDYPDTRQYVLSQCIKSLISELYSVMEFPTGSQNRVTDAEITRDIEILHLLKTYCSNTEADLINYDYEHALVNSIKAKYEDLRAIIEYTVTDESEEYRIIENPFLGTFVEHKITGEQELIFDVFGNDSESIKERKATLEDYLAVRSEDVSVFGFVITMEREEIYKLIRYLDNLGTELNQQENDFLFSLEFCGNYY